MKFRIMMLAVAFAAISVFTAFADNMKPGKGVTVRPARATWDTGYFQEAIVSAGLKELGYKVKKPKELTNPLFYQSVVLGDLDYWTNGWFPMHNDQLPKNFEKKAERIGYVAKAGGLQGYLISKDYAEKYNIKSLDDFRRDDVRKAFDSDGDGKADLIACPPGWGCEKIISHQMDAYGLKDYINPIKASYSASMAEGIAKFKNGEPVFFYTWAPNWTIFKLKPGEDVVWINVPEINPTEAQKGYVDRMTGTGIKGAVSDPIKLGFVVTDIRVVANKKFLKENPAAATFLREFHLDLEDINAQNARMNEGEKSAKDIAKHAQEWIAKHPEKWNKWLSDARAAAK
ncbi:Substrate-binding region of ABC-type glycine betaine transport system [Denitrovibrio acetiphilus DSM 12809]|uniref:Substrate-binding region of ABC-type glycine betaine transport system n=1 Tax=Denitrovibrio acetiphilus (strain DSM 12809 / NBRC 114555 / N2460) TaxID=522772 RepID=D4H1N9_DENA2|nr:glycine betaine/L-proline ABC transporter substrate-binding protein ProX [Denitrovibrio acetiphilus]ADD68799.1 Substrate-binding region of ABC-type glycine betaine transport system [Denitrovibrio acetiphilus DSM 12809]